MTDTTSEVAGTLLWPATPFQQALVALAELGTAPGRYLGQAIVTVTGPVEEERARAAIAALVSDHPNLHAGLLMGVDVTPTQFVEPGLAPLIEVFRPSEADPRTVEAAVTDLRRRRRGEEWLLDVPPLICWDLVLGPAGEGGVLLITAHHAVLDGWSMPLLVQRLAEHYARNGGLGPETGAAGVPSSSYAAHLAAESGKDADAAAAFWRSHFPDLVGADSVPVPWRLEPSQESPVLDVQRRRIPAGTALTRRLADAGVTPAALARTVWGLALHAVAGDREAIAASVGSPASAASGVPFAVAVTTRDPGLPDVANLIGLLSDAALVADPVDPASSVLECARAGQLRWQASLPHQHVGLRGVHAALQTAELATSLLSVEPVAVRAVHSAGPVSFSLREVEDDTHYPITASVGVGEGSWTLEVSADPARVRAGTAGRLADAVVALIASAAAVPGGPAAGAADAPIARIDVRGEADRQLVPVPPVSSPQAPRPATPLLPEAFTRIVRRFPDRVALVGADASGRRSERTFGELRRDVTELGERLLATLPGTRATARPGEVNREPVPVVAICRPRSAEVVVALLAVLEAGCAAMVLDPALPEARRRQILDDTGAAAMIDATGPRPLAGTMPDDARHDSGRSTGRALHPDGTACVVLTSGSTGLPKPVAVSHRAMADLVDHHVGGLHPAAGEPPIAVAHTASFHFDAHWDALAALFGGHTVHVLAEDLYLDPFALAGYLDRQSIEYLDLTPTVWSALLAAEAFTRWPATCVLGGEALPQPLWSRMSRAATDSGVLALNLYGPTEGTVDAAWARVGESDEPIVGRALGSTGLLVLDPWLRPVPVGTPGELYLTGPRLADGYLDRAALTAERFVANPYPRRDDSGQVLVGDHRMYRTGDVAAWTEAGLVRLGGRSDEQLNLAGRRVEPGEIEAVMAGPDIAAAAVTLVPVAGGRPALVGLVVPNAGAGTATDAGDVTERTLRRCRDRLPAALVPSRVIAVAALPLTRNGKLARRELPGLPELAAGRSPVGETAAEPVPDPSDPAQEAVRQALAGALGRDLDELRPTADFFELGGDSIAAIQFCIRLRSVGWVLAPAAVLQLRSIARIVSAATLLVPEASNGAVGAPSGGVVGSADETGPALFDEAGLDASALAELRGHIDRQSLVPVAVRRLSPTQLGIHIDAHRAAIDPYRTTTVLHLEDVSGSLTAEAVHAAVTAVFDRHEALRIGVWQGPLPEPVAFVVRRVPLPHNVIDADGRDIDVLLAEVSEAERDRDLDAEAARLAGYTWVRVDDTHSYLVLGLHHVLVDGWSTPLLAQELTEQLCGRPVPGVDRAFADHLRWWAGQDTAALEQVWRAEFAGVPAAPRLGSGAGGGSLHRVVVRQEVAEPAALIQAGREIGCTAAALLQAAWARAVARATGRRRVGYLLSSAGRPAEVPGVDNGVGMFVLTHPVHADAAAPRAELTGAIADVLARTEVAAHLGLGRIGRLVGRLPDSLLVIENYPFEEHRGAGPVTATPRSGSDTTTFPVTATAMLRGGLALEVEVDPAVTEVDAHRLLRGWADALTELLDGAEPADLADLADSAEPAELGELAELGETSEPDGATTASGLGRPAAPVAATGSPGSTGSPGPDASTQPGAYVEDVLAVMADVLAEAGHDPVGLDAQSSFFASGGDSILAIRLVGALHAAGLQVGIADVFAAPAPAALAGLARPVDPEHDGAVSLAADEVPFTPALAWYAERLRQGADLRGMVQLRTVDFPAHTSVTAVAGAAEELLRRHQGLRLAVHADAATATITSPRSVDISVTTTPFVGDEVRRLAAQLDPAAGDLMRWVLAVEPNRLRLVVIAHHLGVDAVSWAVIAAELQALAGAVTSPSAVAGSPADSMVNSAAESMGAAPSFADWARAQAAAAQLPSLAAVQGRQALTAASPWSPRADRTLLGNLGGAIEHEALLDVATTAKLIAKVAAGQRMEALLAAALTAERRDDLVIDLEGHGRPTAAPQAAGPAGAAGGVGAADNAGGDPRDSDQARRAAGAVGWFTATWPVRLPGRTERAGTPIDAEQVRRCARAIESARASGPDYGLARHLGAEADSLAELEHRAPQQVLLNYLGSSPVSPDDELDPARLEAELGLHDDLPLSHPGELNAWLAPTPDGSVLVARWILDASLAPDAAELLTGWLHGLKVIADLDLGEAGAGAVHDLAGLGPAELDRLTRTPAVEAIWEPTPVQRGMIFHAATATDRYTSVLDLTLSGPPNGDPIDTLDGARLRRAVQAVVAAHPQLRSRVAWTGPKGERPVMVALATPDVDWLAERGDASLADRVAAELMARRYDLGHSGRSGSVGGALLAVRLVSGGGQGSGEHRLLIGNHHLLLDGWSMPLLVEQILAAYGSEDAGDETAAAAGGPAAAVVRPWVTSGFARHVAARASGDNAARSEAAIDRRAGLLAQADTRPITVPGAAIDSVSTDPGQVTDAVRLPLSRPAVPGATDAALLGTAWGTVLATLAGRAEVLLATVVSGRGPAEQQLIGMFADTVPILVRAGTTVDAADPVTEVGAQLAAAVAEPPVGMAALAGRLGRAITPDALLVVENYPLGDLGATPGGLRITGVAGDDATHYPLALTAEPTSEAEPGRAAETLLRMEFDTRLLTEDDARSVLAAVRECALDLARGDRRPVALAPEEATRIGAGWRAADTAVTSGTEPGNRIGAEPGSEIGSGPGTRTSPDRHLDGVLAAFGEVFGHEVRAEDNFFTLGGDSILAMSLVTACRRRALVVSAAAVFTGPTPAALAAAATDLTAVAPAAGDPAAAGSTGAGSTGAGTELIQLDDRGAATLNDLLRNLP